MLPGSFVERQRKCGKPNCRCAQGKAEDLHVQFLLPVLRQGKLKTFDIPARRAVIDHLKTSLSDHVSTHCSYALIYGPSTGRGTIVESMRQRYACAATGNIILDYRAVDAQGRGHMMGDAFEASAAPRLVVKIIGTDRITDVDNNPGGGESYYLRSRHRDRPQPGVVESDLGEVRVVMSLPRRRRGAEEA